VKFYNQGPASDALLLLATGASVNQVLEPIYSNTIWGAGWYNAPTAAHYADHAVRFEGSIDFELQMGAAGKIWDFVGDWLINERAYPRSVDISPDGARVYEYHTTGAYGANYDNNGIWCGSASFSTSEGSFVTVSATAIALIRTEVDPAGGHDYSDYSYIKQKRGVTDCTELAATNPLNPGGTNVNPIPFWRTNAELLRGTYTDPFTGGTAPQTGIETIEWSVDLANNQVVLYTCNGNRLPTALLMGAIDATGSVTLYHEDGVFDPILGPTGTEGTLTNPYMYAQNTWFRVSIDVGGGTTVYLEVPAVVIEGDDYGLKGQSDVTSRGFSIHGLGGRCTSGAVLMPPLVMSDSSGNFVTP
jgi:hypothetical protein